LSAGRKVFVLGFDGATFKIIDKLVAEGELPNLSKLMKEGSRRVLRSTIPPNSSVAWSSMMTGKDPGKHGVYYFRERKLGDYRRPLISSRSLKAKTLWRIINEQGGKTGVLNVPVTYPPEPVDGFLISGLLAPHRASIFTHPSSLHLELIKEFGEYPLDNEAQNMFWRGDVIGALEHLIFTSRRLLDVTCWLMDRFPWSFFMTVFTAVDRVQHVAWRHMTEEYARRKPRECEKFREMVPLVYKLMDEHLGELLKVIGEDTSLIVLSDHGFGPINYKFHVNKWLIEQGFLSLKSFPGFRYDPMTSALDRLGLGRFRVAPPVLTNGPIGRFKRLRFRRADWEGYHDLVDWTRTRVYSTFSSGEEVLFVNLKGREPNGVVDPADYDKVCEEVSGRLMELKGKDGEQLVERVYRREEIYHGPYLELAPDLQYVTRDYSVLPRSELFAESILVRPEDCFPSMHRREGILIMKSPEILKGASLGDAHLRDVGPTALYLMDYSVPDDMDGKVLEDSFVEGTTQERPVKIKHVSRGDLEDGTAEKSAYSQEEEEDVMKALKGLGYMG